MADKSFDTDVLRLIAAELYYLVGAEVAQSMFGKSYSQLAVVEKVAVDQATLGHVGGNFQMITPEWLQGQKTQNPIGFQAPTTPSRPTT